MDDLVSSGPGAVAVVDGVEGCSSEPLLTGSHQLYGHILRAVGETPWALLPSKLQAIVDLLALRASGLRLSEDEIRERIGPRAATSVPSTRNGAVAILPLYGVISQRMDMFSASSGGTSTERFGQAFQQAVDDPAVAAIVLDVDSPGGSAFGVEELARQIHDARGSKPIVAVVNSLCASAAYWLASQADETVTTPGGLTGSIGVYTVHEDLSKAAEMAGVKTTYVSAGKYKVETQPFQPLSEEARAGMQNMVDDCYSMFLSAVARGRGVPVDEVRNGYGQGRVLPAKQAQRAGLVDRIATLDQTVRRLSHAPSRARMQQRAALMPFIGTETVSGMPVRSWDLVHPITSTQGAAPMAVYDLQAAATPVHDSPSIADENTPWDAGEVERNLPDDQSAWKRVFAWYDDNAPDPDGDGLPDAKNAWKLPHAKADGTLVPRGLHAAAARLNQSNIPASDMAAVKRHLAHHYAELKQTPPWEAEAEPAHTDPEPVREPATTASPTGGRRVEEQEFREAAAKYEAQIADKDRQLAALQEASKTQADQIAALVAADRRRRFTDIVMGRSGEHDGQRWYGDVSKNVAMLERLAVAFGEDSEDFKAFVDLQQANAQQLDKVTHAIGSDAAPEANGKGGAWSRIEAEAEKLMAADTKLTREQAATQVMERQPNLYSDYLAEIREGK